MSLIVQKYGGTSVGDAGRIQAVARRVAEAKRAGNDVVVVVSAMGDTTDDLIRLSQQVSPNEHPREMDVLLTAGERITMALLAMAIRDLGVEAISLTGSQAGILTDTVHGRAEIRDVRAFRVKESLEAGKVVIVAGFQGVSADSKEITTLGRGGSDATAVAMAAYLGADVCEIYTDVDGVYTADPRVVPEARKLNEVSFEEMLELASSGAKVLMARSVELGQKFNVPLHVRSSFHDAEGTWVREITTQQTPVVGVAHDRAIARVSIFGMSRDVKAIASLFQSLSAAGVNVDMIVQSPSSTSTVDLSFTVPREQVAAARTVAEAVAARSGGGGVEVDGEVGVVSVVGTGMRSHAGIAGGVFRALSDAGIDIQMVSTSQIRVSCVVAAERVEEAVRLLHSTYESLLIPGEGA